VSLVQEVLDALRIRHVGVEGYEADDVLATMARQAAEQGMKVVICSGDRDAMQLVTEDVTLLYPVRGVSEMFRMTPEAVTERYGVSPKRYRDLAALVGESSDNLPGVPGVGPKTAAKWIEQFGGIDGVVAKVDQIKGKAGESLRENLAGVLRNYELNRLVDDVSVPLPVPETRWPGWDREAVARVFDALEFRVLRDRLYQYLEIEEPSAEGGISLVGEVIGAISGAVVTRVRRPRVAAPHGMTLATPRMASAPTSAPTSRDLTTTVLGAPKTVVLGQPASSQGSLAR